MNRQTITETEVKDIIREVAKELSSDAKKVFISLTNFGNSRISLNTQVYLVDGNGYSENSYGLSISNLDKTGVKNLVKAEVENIMIVFLLSLSLEVGT